MKFIYLLIATFFTVLPSLAQLSGNGYYRVKNYKTDRYVYVTDNKGKLNYESTTADMYAIQLWKNFDKACCDPATVCYIEGINVENKEYDIKSQGTGIYEIIQSYVRIRSNSDGTYYAYGTKDGVTKYLSDGEKADSYDKGVMSDAGKGDYRKWNIIPIGTADDNFLGVKTNIDVAGSHYTSYYTAFPYSFASSGMNAYYISKVDKGVAVMKEISGVIPAYTPVFIKASSDQPASNKLNVGGDASAIGDNQLSGVFFNNDMKTHYNRVAYDPNTMRLLGITSDGSLGFITSDIDFIPANHAYLNVPEGTPAELRIVTEDEYNNLKMPESIKIDEVSKTIGVGETVQLHATVMPEDAYDKTIKWITCDPNIVTVDNNGLVTGVNPGVMSVLAETVNGLQAKCEIIVKEPGVLATSITLDKDVYEAVEGSVFTLNATVLPENVSNPAVAWDSSDKEVATVDNGTVKVLKEGTAKIIASTTDGTNLTATCIVNGVSGIEEIISDTNNFPINVYSISGQLVKIAENVNDFKALLPGIYVVGNKKIVIAEK